MFVPTRHIHQRHGLLDMPSGYDYGRGELRFVQLVRSGNLLAGRVELVHVVPTFELVVDRRGNVLRVRVVLLLQLDPQELPLLPGQQHVERGHGRELALDLRVHVWLLGARVRRRARLLVRRRLVRERHELLRVRCGHLLERGQLARVLAVRRRLL